MTKDEAVKILTDTWGGCVDAWGLLTALERIGAVKFDKPRRERLLERAERWRQVGGIIEVNHQNMLAAAQLICEMAAELGRGGE